MRITQKGQVTIPQEIREKLGLLPYAESVRQASVALWSTPVLRCHGRPPFWPARSFSSIVAAGECGPGHGPTS